jgi:DNA topoisomerase-1
MARYKKKFLTEKGNTVYEYSPRQVARRNNQKAERLEKLNKNIGKLKAQVKKDLSSGDPDKALAALAIALIDHTYERVGNNESAGEGHVGVTGWERGHISFSKGKATIKYVGKSGVSQKKTVTDKAILRALRDAYEAAEDGESIFQHDTGTVDAARVNAYLKRFNITAKDIRGLHANREMREALKAIRKGALPEDSKERKVQLKDEWKKALEMTAKAVGHEASTLRSQYLVPGLEDEFLKDGTIMEKMKKASSLALRVATLYLRG